MKSFQNITPETYSSFLHMKCCEFICSEHAIDNIFGPTVYSFLYITMRQYEFVRSFLCKLRNISGKEMHLLICLHLHVSKCLLCFPKIQISTKHRHGSFSFPCVTSTEGANACTFRLDKTTKSQQKRHREFLIKVYSRILTT